jgi:tRNA pseudouridine32 synthase / 23S rRNA pseudouridine746 synthase
LVMFSVNAATRDAYQSLFRTRAVTKNYHAIAPVLRRTEWPLHYRSRLVEDEQFFRTQEVAGEANSETHISLLEEAGVRGRYLLQPVTGRKHQLRVHLASLGIPIENDPLYPAVQDRQDNDFSRPLQLLAKTLSFTDPLTGETRFFESRQELFL